MNRLQALFTIILLTFFANILSAQMAGDLPELSIQKQEVEAHLRFLASDELQGRRTSDPGSEIAARYIAEQYRSYGLKQVDGAKEYFQTIPFKNVEPAKEGKLQWGESIYTNRKNLLILTGTAIDTSAEAVFANHGWVDEEKGINDYKDLDVKGKIVFVISGMPENNNPYATFKAMSTKRQIAANHGAIALIELYRLSFPWQFFSKYFSRERLEIAEENDNQNVENLVYGWIKENDGNATAALSKGEPMTVKLSSSGAKSYPKPSNNVIGLIEGTDPELKNEFVLITAHYDHVGVGEQGGAMYTPEDSIFNGARDNGMGTVALLAAAKTLAQSPPKRSVILLACTAEEMGLLGSKYYVENPLIPLNQTVINLNTDGAGYDDTNAISVVGYDRINVTQEYNQAAQKFGLRVIADPAPEQNLFDRSDNVNFAIKGIPAPSISPGTTGFTPEIAKYYHQVIDNPESIDYDYLLTFCKTFSHLVRLIADRDEAPKWSPGDKYEEASKKLYGKDE